MKIIRFLSVFIITNDFNSLKTEVFKIILIYNILNKKKSPRLSGLPRVDSSFLVRLLFSDYLTRDWRSKRRTRRRELRLLIKSSPENVCPTPQNGCWKLAGYNHFIYFVKTFFIFFYFSINFSLFKQIK